MTTSTQVIGGETVEIVRKAIKNLHLGVYPPHGRIRVAAPLAMSESAVRVAIVRKLRWIRRQQAAFRQQARQSERQMVSGESHYYLGRRYRLAVVKTWGRCDVVLRPGAIMEIRVRATSDLRHRERVVARWYRERLRVLIPPLVTKWQAKLGVRLAAWGIKAMKTRWGEEAARVPRLHHRPRADPPRGPPPRRALLRSDGRAPAPVAADPAGAQRRPARACEVGSLTWPSPSS
jgi:predicted metal-dependent hydrolase